MAQFLKHLFDAGGDRTSPVGSNSAQGFMDNGGLASYINMISKLASALETARAEGSKTYSELGRSVQAWGDLSTKAARSVLDALTANQTQLTGSVAAHSRAEQAKSLATAAAMKHTAFYKAVAATAAGFQALGEFNFWSAAQDFTSAALWGTLAGMQVASASGASASQRGGSGSSYRSGAAGGGQGHGSSPGVAISALGAGAASAAHGPSGHLTVAIMGDNQAGEWLANTLNTAVETRGVQLTSTRSTRSAYAQG